MQPRRAAEELRKLRDQAGTPEIRRAGPEHTSWKAKADALLEMALGRDSETLRSFRELRYHIGVWTGAPGEAEQDARYFAGRVEHAAGLIGAAIYQLELHDNRDETDTVVTAADQQPGRAGSTISGGTFYGPVLQGRDIRATFPGPVPQGSSVPATSHLPAAQATSGMQAAGHVIISYVREDAPQVDQLQDMLQAAGIPVWRDTADLWPGEDWRAKIRAAINDNALVFLACFSTRSLARDRSYQNEELILAIEQLRQRPPERPWLIPVRFDDCPIPDRDTGAGRTLSSIQCADLFGDRYDDQAQRLTAAIQQILGHHPATTTGGTGKNPAPAAPPAPPGQDRGA